MTVDNLSPRFPRALGYGVFVSVTRTHLSFLVRSFSCVNSLLVSCPISAAFRARSSLFNAADERGLVDFSLIVGVEGDVPFLRPPRLTYGAAMLVQCRSGDISLYLPRRIHSPDLYHLLPVAYQLHLQTSLGLASFEAVRIRQDRSCRRVLDMMSVPIDVSN